MSASLTPDDTHDLRIGRRATVLEGISRESALFSREWSAFIVSLFLWESSALVCPFSRENWGDHLPPAARVQSLEETEITVIADGAR